MASILLSSTKSCTCRTDSRSRFLTGDRLATSSSPSIQRGGRAAPLQTKAVFSSPYGDKMQTAFDTRTTNKDVNKDTVFDFTLWKRHRLIDRYSRHVTSVTNSAIFQRALFPCLSVTGLAALWAFYADFFGPVPSAPVLPFGLTSATLSLLLVFRTNASYDRYWEARKIWGGLLNRTRDLARQSEWIEDEQFRAKFVRYIVAFMRSLKVHIRPGEDLKAELSHLLDRDDLAQTLVADNRPMHIIQVLTEMVKQANLSEVRVNTMDSNLTFFQDTLGDCERLVRCPIPRSYTRHTSRFIILYLSLLPLCLYKDFGAWMIPTIFIISYAMLGIEEIGVRIEEPFSRLNLEAICNTCETNLIEVVGVNRSVKKLVSNATVQE